MAENALSKTSARAGGWQVAAPDRAVSRAASGSLEKQRIRLYALLLAFDGVAMAGAILLAASLYVREALPAVGIEIALGLTPLFLLLAFYHGLYSIPGVSSQRKMIVTIVQAAVLATILFVIANFLAKTSEMTSRFVLTSGVVLGTLLVASGHAGLVALAKRKFGIRFQNIMLVDAGGPPVSLPDAFRYTPKDLCLDAIRHSPERLGELGERFRNMDRVIVSCPAADRANWAFVLQALGVRGEVTSDTASEFGLIGGVMGLEVEEDFTTLLIATGPLGLRDRLVKRCVDLAIVLPSLILLAPLFLAVALAIKLDDGGPVLFRQRRVGRNAVFFAMLKFRTMRTDRCDADGAHSTRRSDDRITRIGGFLRRTSLDELPQLFNVLAGSMSLVGPRPHAIGSRAGEKLFWEVTHDYWLRHAMKPGMTGLAQVRGHRGATTREEDLKLRLRSDLEYLSGWTPLRDLAIIARTVRVLTHANAY